MLPVDKPKQRKPTWPTLLKARSRFILVSPSPQRQPIKRLKSPQIQKKSSHRLGKNDQKLVNINRETTTKIENLGTTAKIKPIKVGAPSYTSAIHI